MDRGGKLVIPTIYEDIACSADELLPFKSEDRWGFLDPTGEIVLVPQFEDLAPETYDGTFSEGLAAVRFNGKWGFIDSVGNFQIPPQFAYATRFHEGYALVSADAVVVFGITFRPSKPIFIDRNGQRLFTGADFTPENPFHGGLARVSHGGKFGYIDKSGNYAVPETDKHLSGDFHEGLVVFNEEPLGNFGYADKFGNTVIPPIYKQAGEFSEGRAPVMFGNCKYGYIDIRGNPVIEPQYDFADNFYGSLAAVMIGNKMGYIDNRGNPVTPIKFGSAERFVDGLAKVSFDDQNPPYDEKKFGYIDGTGNFIWEPTN